METKEKAFKAFNHGTGKIDLSRHPGVIQYRPTEIHLKEDGTKTGDPVFGILMEHPGKPVFISIFGQISLEMLNEGLEELGYKITKI